MPSSTEAPPRADTWFLGHSTGLFTISLTEAWVGFAYYGMLSLLTLYMTSYVLTAQHQGHILLFAPFHAFLNALYGQRQGKALASAITGLFSALAYGLPIVGGMVADKFLGRTRTIMLGAAFLTLGMFLIAYDRTFLLALGAISLGMGCCGAIKAQVGGLYAPDDNRRADAFQVFMLIFNMAVIVAPLVCGTLGEGYTWSWGFFAAGIGMALGLTAYLVGLKTLPPEPPRLRRTHNAPRQRLTARERNSLLLLACLLPVLAMAALGNQEIFNGYMIWAKQYYQLRFFGHTMPVAFLISMDAIISSITMAGVLLFWRWYEKRRGNLAEIVKVAIGAGISALAPFILAAASFLANQGHHKVGLGWGIAFHTVNDIGFANIYSIGLSLYSRVAPPRLAATVVNGFVLHIFLANLFVGYLAGLLETMAAPEFWLLHAGLIAAAALILFACARLFHPLLAPTKP